MIVIVVGAVLVRRVVGIETLLPPYNVCNDSVENVKVIVAVKAVTAVIALAVVIIGAVIVGIKIAVIVGIKVAVVAVTT